jgi:putative endonuclease
MHHFYGYILSSKSRVLYTGITDDIYRRTWEHKNDINRGFTSDYKVHRLVYYETFKYVNNAIAREKSIKRWLRRKKIALIEAKNPTWEDLSESWFDGKTGPSLRSGWQKFCSGRTAEDQCSYTHTRLTHELQDAATRLRRDSHHYHPQPPGQAQRRQLRAH